jgi:hypothetical protein
LIEQSSDLKTWTNLTTVSSPSGTLEMTDPAAGETGNKFYRAVEAESVDKGALASSGCFSGQPELSGRTSASRNRKSVGLAAETTGAWVEVRAMWGRGELSTLAALDKCLFTVAGAGTLSWLNPHLPHPRLLLPAR